MDRTVVRFSVDGGWAFGQHSSISARRPISLKNLLLIVGLATSAILTSCASKATAPAVPVIAHLGWPRSFTSGGVTYTVYQPQLRSWDQVQLTTQAVVAT